MMTKTQLFTGTFTFLALSGAVAMMQPVRAEDLPAPQTNVVAQADKPVTVQAWALNATQKQAAAAQPAMQPAPQMPKQLPLANFGQWDEAASEN